jgi:hypothetical protein
VKALVKPSVPAWALNQVYWHDRPAFDAAVRALAGVGAAQREAVVGSTSGDLREAMRRKSEALNAAARIAERRVVESGGAGGQALVQRLSTTLEALASPRPSGAPAPRPGRLDTELKPVGFDLAFGLEEMDLPAPPPAPAVKGASGRGAQAEAPAAPPEVSEAEKLARARLARAEADVNRLSREVQAAERTLGEAEQRLAAARADASGLEARLADANARVATRAAAEDDARRALASLRRELADAEKARSSAQPPRAPGSRDRRS